MKATDPAMGALLVHPSLARVDPTSTIRSIRLQAAIVRELLDELELRTTPGEGEVAAQLAEEVGRLGGDLLRASNLLRHHVAAERA